MLVHAKRGLSNAARRSRGAGTCEADVSGCVGLATRVQTWPSQTAGSGEGRRVQLATVTEGTPGGEPGAGSQSLLAGSGREEGGG